MSSSWSSSSGSLPDVVTIGPLTTIFTPPPPCTTPLLKPDDPGSSDSNTILLYAYNCTSTGASNRRGDASLCFPSGYFTDERGGYFDTRFGKFQAFAPASLCPQGYISACGASHDPRPGFQGASELLPLVKSTEALQICCPTGWGCQLDNLATINCELTFTSEPVTATICADQGSSGAFGTFSGSTVFGIASAIALIRPFDFNEIQTAGSSPGAAPSSTPEDPLSPSTSIPDAGGGVDQVDGEAHGLSGGAKAGIGVGVTIGALLIIAFIAFLWYRKYSTKDRRYPIADSVANLPEFKSELQDNQVMFSQPERIIPCELSIGEADTNAHRRTRSHEHNDNTMVGSMREVSPLELESPHGVELHNNALPIELDSARVGRSR